jgi:hypothetical protein
MTSLSIVNQNDWSEIGFHVKYVSVILMFIQLHMYHKYLVLFDLDRSNDIYKVAHNWQ